MSRNLLIVALAIGIAFSDSAFAQGTVDGAKAFGWLQPYVEAAASAIIMFGLGWMAWILKAKWGIEIDAGQREVLHSFLSRQAASLVADGFVKVNGLKIEVPSAVLASAANSAAVAIPSALEHFGLTPQKIQQMIVDKIPAVPSVAAVAAAQVAPSPAVVAP